MCVGSKTRKSNALNEVAESDSALALVLCRKQLVKVLCLSRWLQLRSNADPIVVFSILSVTIKGKPIMTQACTLLRTSGASRQEVV